MVNSKFNVKYCVFLPIVLVITIFLWAVPTSFFGIDALTPVQQRVIALFVFAALMWMFEIVPNWTTSLLVIVLSLLTVSDKGLSFLCKPEYGTLVNYKSLMSAFADPVIMLFLGGFVLAIMASKYGLDVTLARVLLKPFGKKPKMVLLGFLIVIAVFSMFMSNTATAAMMLALLAPVLASLPKDDRGRVGLALSIPVSANLGGIGTTIGTPPNATAVRFLNEAGHEVAFDTWAIHMIPFVIIMVLIAWVLLQMFFPFKSEEIVLNIPENKRKKDWKTTVVWITFAGTILLWATEQLTGINSNIVALIPLGVLTCTGIFTKEDIKEINWTVLWLVAGGFALGTALQGTGLAENYGITGRKRFQGKVKAVGKIIGTAAGNISQRGFMTALKQAGDDLIQGAVTAAGNNKVRFTAMKTREIDSIAALFRDINRTKPVRPVEQGNHFRQKTTRLADAGVGVDD